MPRTTPPPVRTLAAALVLGAGALASGCSTAPDRADPVVVDGRATEWRNAELARVDAETVALRIPFERALTYRDAGVVIEIDADADAATGRAIDGLGVDMRIAQSDLGRRERGLRGGTAYDATSAVPTLVTPVQMRLHVAPTHAADEFEVRFDRADVPAFAEATEAVVRVTASDPSLLRGALDGALEARVPVPPAKVAAETGDAPNVADAPIPAKPAGAVRVIAWNVLWSGPENDPEAFARLLGVLRPDILLLQEWGRGEVTEDTVKAWFDRHAAWADTGSRGWSVSEHEAWGVAVATPHPILDRAGSGLMAPGSRWDFPVRMAAAAIDVDGTVVAAGSVHYKCCGALDTEEDTRRLLEADATNAAMRTLAGSADADVVVLGGDFNMNGTFDVMRRSIAGLDTDGSDNSIAQPFQLGFPIQGTFGQPQQRTTAPRLDYITYSDASARVAGQFVLDTTRLSDDALERAGLEREDTVASDHLPVVVDLMAN